MRFDLLDEYSTLVPFGSGVSRNEGSQDDPVVPTKETKRAIASLVDHLESLRTRFGALRRRRCRVTGV